MNTPFALLLVVKATLLLLVIAVGTRLLRRESAALQHLLWTLALAGVLFLPLVSVTLPGWPMPGRVVPRFLSAKSVTPSAYALPTPLLGKSAAVSPTSAPLGTSVIASRTQTTSFLHSAAFTVSSVLLTNWLAVMSFLLCRFVGNWLALRELKRNSMPVQEETLLIVLRRNACILGLKICPELRMGTPEAGVFSPMTWGWQRGIVLLPAGADAWSAAHLEAVLLHELAHVRRGDWRTQRLAEIACALYWFHPLVWLAARRLRETAERAADDMALTSGVLPGDYARQLLDMLQTLHTARKHAYATLPFLRGLPIEQRLRAILDTNTPRYLVSQRTQGIAGGAGALCLIGLAAIRPLSAQAASITTLSSPSAGTITAREGTVTLSDGVRLEVLGINDPASDPTPANPLVWWKPDGTPIVAPYEAKPHPTMIDGRTKDWPQRLFGIRISGLKEENVDTLKQIVYMEASKRKTLDFGDSFAENQLTHSQNGRYTIVRSDMLKDAHLPDRCRLRYGVAMGAWQDAAKLRNMGPAYRGVYILRPGTRVVFETHYDPNFTQIRPDGTPTHGQLIQTNDNLGQVARRLLAITRTGKTVQITTLYTGPLTPKTTFGSGPMTAFTCLLPEGLTVDQVKEFRLQTRPYEWAEFPNVHLHPTGNARAFTSVGKSF